MSMSVSVWKSHLVWRDPINFVTIVPAFRLWYGA